MSEKWMDVFFEAQSEEQILTCFSVLSGFHSTFIIIIAVIVLVAAVIGAFLKNRKISESQISSLFISSVCLKTMSHLIKFKATLYRDKYIYISYLDTTVKKQIPAFCNSWSDVTLH